VKDFSTILIFTGLLLLLELLYFRIAGKFGITDQPNHRSSHQTVTIRGGGIIFSVAILLSAILTNTYEIWFLAGLALISIISFLDDIKPRNYKIRMLIHLAAVGLLFIQTGIFSLPLIIIVIALFFAVGTINAINFMDGINGITGMYGLLTLSSFLYVNELVHNFIPSGYIISVIIAVIVFLIFNFRKRALCFAGDVGSVSLAFILLFFTLSLIIITNNCSYILFLLVYGLDVVTTIIFRMIRKENISVAHRSHFYQYLVHDKKMSHLMVASIYTIVQMIVNIFVLHYRISVISDIILILMTTGILFVIIRFIFEGSIRLLTGVKNN